MKKLTWNRMHFCTKHAQEIDLLLTLGLYDSWFSARSALHRLSSETTKKNAR